MKFGRITRGLGRHLGNRWPRLERQGPREEKWGHCREYASVLHKGISAERKANLYKQLAVKEKGGVNAMDSFRSVSINRTLDTLALWTSDTLSPTGTSWGLGQACLPLARAASRAPEGHNTQSPNFSGCLTVALASSGS